MQAKRKEKGAEEGRGKTNIQIAAIEKLIHTPIGISCGERGEERRSLTSHITIAPARQKLRLLRCFCALRRKWSQKSSSSIGDENLKIKYK
jgi:hypothetical protein